MSDILPNYIKITPRIYLISPRSMLLRSTLRPYPRVCNLSFKRISTMTSAALSNGTSVSPILDSERPPAQVPQLSEAEIISQKYRPFLLPDGKKEADWVSALELDAVTKFVEEQSQVPGYTPLKFLVLYGSLREWYILPSTTDIPLSNTYVC